MVDNVIVKFEDLMLGSVVRRKYIYLNLDKVNYIEMNNKRIHFNYGWIDKRVVASDYNIKQLKKVLGDVEL